MGGIARASPFANFSNEPRGDKGFALRLSTVALAILAAITISAAFAFTFEEFTALLLSTQNGAFGVVGLDQCWRRCQADNDKAKAGNKSTGKRPSFSGCISVKRLFSGD